MAVLHYYLARVALQEDEAPEQLLQRLWSGNAARPLPPCGTVAAAETGLSVMTLLDEAASTADSPHVHKPLENVGKMKVVQLRAELQSRGLNTKGLRKDLLSRLQMAAAEEAETARKTRPAKAVRCIAARPNAANAPIVATTAVDGFSLAAPVAAAKATALLNIAFSACRNLGMPTLVNHIGLLLAQTHGQRHQLRAAMHQHMSLGIAARQAVCLKLVGTDDGTHGADAATLAAASGSRRKRSAARGGPAKGNGNDKSKASDPSAVTHATTGPAMAPDPLDVFSFHGVVTEADFKERYVRGLPADLTVCGISVDPDTNGVLLSRLSAHDGGTAWCRRISPQPIDRLDIEDEELDAAEEGSQLPGISGLCERFARIQCNWAC